MTVSGSAALAGVIDSLHPLPSPRGVALELLRLSRDENASVADVAHVAQADPVLAARLIRAANGAAHGAVPTGSLKAAVLRLGFAATCHVALAFSLLNDHRRGGCAGFDYQAFWSQSLLRALAARAVAARLGTADPQEALVAALLAEIGRLALASARPAAYGELLAQHGQSGVALRAAEQERFGIDHGALGAALLARWTLPSPMVVAVESYFAPPLHLDGPDRAVRHMGWTLLLAQAIARAITQAGAPGAERAAWTHMALLLAARLDANADAAMLDEVTDEVVREAAAWSSLLELPAPALVMPGFASYTGGGTDADSEVQARLRILVVDDDESDRLLVEHALRQAGHLVQLAEDGQEALAAISTAMPQLVITDVDMPVLDGLALCRSLRACAPGACLQVIVLTGYFKHEVLAACIDAGANDFVTKSAAYETLLARVRAAARAVQCMESLQGDLDRVRFVATGLALANHKLEQQASGG